MFVLQTVFFKQLKQIFISKEKKEFKTISDLLVFVFQKEKKSVSSLCLALSSNNFLSVSKLAEIHLTTQPRHITADGFPSGLCCVSFLLRHTAALFAQVTPPLPSGPHLTRWQQAAGKPYGTRWQMHGTAWVVHEERCETCTRDQTQKYDYV